MSTPHISSPKKRPSTTLISNPRKRQSAPLASIPRKRQHPNEDEEADNEEQENMNISDDEGGTTIEGIYIPPPVKPVTSLRTETRLIITRITNNFFKSYAHEQVLGPFHKCFNAIVGPNGSGKSNVIDSMLFVFGYRATKIRSKKVSVLLHNSEKYRNVQSCTVSVHFCEIKDKPGDDYEIIPGSEFVVSRTANKDNSSFYQLNDRKVQFKEVGRLLKNHGIDLDHNRFLILQGEVEEIAMMKCKASNENETGMLEYLEDIIGTNKYKKPLGELTEKIEVLSEVRTEKVNRLKLVEKELEQLRGPMQEAVGFLKIENSIASKRNLLYQKNIFDLENKAKTLEEEKSKISEAHKELMARLNSFSQEKSEKDKRLKQEAAVYENLQKRKDKVKEAFDRADKRDVQLQADMTQTNTNRKKNKEQLANEKKKLAELELVPDKNLATIAECEAKETDLSAKREKLEEEKTRLLANLRTETQDLQDEKEQLESRLARLKEAVDQTKSAYAVAESDLKIYLSNEENERAKLEKLRETCESSENGIVQTTDELSELKRKIPAMEKSLREATNELDNVKREEARFVNQLTDKRTVLEEKRSSMQASTSRGKVLDSLMQQKREGKCNGLYGRLGDLGAIDQKYDVAISTACGKLDNIVVDSVTTAQWCIEFLKKYGIGRATFIALDKQEHLRHLANSKIKTPENVPRLYDLIKIQDETVKTAFYFSLRDTLVANDLDQASRIAYGAQRYRVVTLKGDLIETSGTMSGGGKTVMRGKMGRSVVAEVDPKVVQKLESDLRNLEEHVRGLQQKQATLEGQVNELEPQLRPMKISYEKLSANLQFLKQQQPVLLEQLKAQEVVSKSTKADPATVKKMTGVMNQKKAEFDKAAAAAQELQVRVDELTKKIKDMTSGRMKALDKSLSDVTKNIDKYKTEITRLRVAIKTAQRNAKNTAEKIATLEKDIENAETNLREMKAQREEIETDGQKLLTCIQEISQQLADMEEAYAELKNEVASLTKEENKIKSEKVDIDQSLKTVTKKLNDCNGTIHQWHAKLSHLKLQEIPHETVEALKKYTSEEMEAISREAIECELQADENAIKSAKPNLNAIQEYQQGQRVYMQRSEELEQISAKRTEMKNVHEKVKNRRKDEFIAGYNLIKMKLKEMYQMITLGGDADFEIVDSFDPFAEGIQFNVRPPKKSWKNISNLSGGEKTLSSLALVFALHYYKPSPLYVMDEIDAALDFKNVSIVGHYIKERTKDAQFIIISLRSNMFELCDNLIGIYKIFNCTQTITIDPRAYGVEDDQVVPSSNHNPEPISGTVSATNGDSQPEEAMLEENADHNDGDTEMGSKEINSVIEDSFNESS